ncbi:GPCR fungal pheromone mating factor [Vararia minispora EC-137]|uniref:GPCR fungal pheromone mating factor n=1 Tax=Vararia minispora EC-137 TaxID=1314806 RepID=A0ACB8QDI7_9AGAM|nr:GPCR fungal pheromone mating factor [Vararia minispora EC-137]
MQTFDPTYPLLPISSVLCAALLLLVLFTRAIGGTWNLGVLILCFWLFLENLTNGVNAVLWADNFQVKHEVYCDIVTHVQIFSSIVRPACTLIITRRLYKIVSLRDIHGQSDFERRFNKVLEVGLAIVLPTFVTAIFYYIVQDHRFVVLEGIGCQYTVSGSALSILLVLSWPIVLPVVSALLYCPRIIRTFRQHNADTVEFLATNGLVTRSRYLRTLGIGCIDIVLSLPFALFKIANLVSSVLSTSKEGRFPFYAGWHATHAHWAPAVLPGPILKTAALWTLFTTWFGVWSAVVLALAIFVLFGLSQPAREFFKCLLSRSAESAREEGIVSRISFTPGRRSARALVFGCSVLIDAV